MRYKGNLFLKGAWSICDWLQVPCKLSKRFPYLVHVEKTKLHRPNFDEIDKMWGPNTWPLQENYALHLWYRRWTNSKYFHGEPNSDNIKTWNSTFGEIARMILFGNPTHIMKDDAQ